MSPATKPIRMRVTASAESGLRRGHPWLYAERIREQSREGEAGELAVVFDRKREFLAVGLYDPHSPIRVHVLRARQPGPVDRTLFAERIEAALARRRPLLQDGRTDGYRMIHGESDGLPGLVADRYADTGVIKVYSRAWLPHLDDVLAVLLEQQPLERVVLRTSRRVDSPDDGTVVHGPGLDEGAPDGPVLFRENGLHFEADPVRGQKTGFFLDQRDNRARVEALARGRRVLDVCACSGGFSAAAARGGAVAVCSLDQSGPALQAAQRNVARNADVPHETLCGDAFRLLPDLGRRFDLVVLDPPAFAHRNAQVPGALDAYGRLARLGLEVLEPDGHLLLASCSRPVSPEDFREAVSAAADRAGRPLRDVEETGHALDHPTDFAESRYLKGLFATA